MEEKKENIKELFKKVDVLNENFLDKNNEFERKDSESNYIKLDLNEVKIFFFELFS